MSAASLLKVYDGLDPELAFQTAAPGTAENIAQVLAMLLPALLAVFL